MTEAEKRKRVRALVAQKKLEKFAAALRLERQGQAGYLGLHVYVSRGLYDHHGIGDAAGGVIHYAGLKEGRDSGPVCRTSLAEFARGEVVKIRYHGHRKYDLYQAVARAESRLGEDAYSAWDNNCEQFVDWCIDGESA